MNSFSRDKLICTVLVGFGLAFSAIIGHHLAKDSEFDYPTNPFGVNRSPYGEVFAMALQGPINRDFHIAMYGIHGDLMSDHLIDSSDPDSEPNQDARNEECKSSSNCAGCEACGKDSQPPKPDEVLAGMKSWIHKMRVGHIERTNPIPPSETLKTHLRAQTEDKLRLAYRLDPAHYANYTALHFFLVEGITTRPELIAGASELAEETIEYCLANEHDPMPALTAAAASTHLLFIMFETEKSPQGLQYSVEQMLTELKRLDQCIEHYDRIAKKWDQNGQWQRISPARFREYENRHLYVLKLRDACIATIERIQSTYAK